MKKQAPEVAKGDSKVEGLRDCPFCGHQIMLAETDEFVAPGNWGDPNGWRLYCSNDFCPIDIQFMDDEDMWLFPIPYEQEVAFEVIEKWWNTRPIEDRLTAELAAANGLLNEVGDWQAQPFHINTYTDLLSILAKRTAAE